MTLKDRLEQGEYRVDATKVADAIVRRPLMWLLLAGGHGPRDQKLCS